MTSYLQTAGWTLMHFVWQGAAIAGTATVLLRLTRRRTASTRYAIACIGLAAMLAAPIVTARLIWTAVDVRPANAAASDKAIKRGEPGLGVISARGSWRPRVEEQGLPVTNAVVRVAQGFRPALERIVPAVTVAWLGGVLLLLSRMAGGWWRVRRLHHIALSTASSHWQTVCRRLAYRLGLPAAAHVVESALVEVPTVVGWLRPAILAADRRACVADARPGRSDPRARARAHSPPRLRGQCPADARGNAAVLPPGGLVDLEADSRGTRALLR